MRNQYLLAFVAPLQLLSEVADGSILLLQDRSEGAVPLPPHLPLFLHLAQQTLLLPQSRTQVLETTGQLTAGVFTSDFR